MGDTNSSLTPEQRLLQLIEGGESSGGAAVQTEEKPVRTKKSAPPVAELLTPAAILSRFASAKDMLMSFARNEGLPVNLKQVNRSVKIFTIGMAIYFIGAMTFELLTTNKGRDFNFEITPREIAEAPVPDSQKYAVDLFEDASRRNVFVPYVEKVEKAPEESTNELSIKLHEIIKDFKLTGISLDPSDPVRTFCMIEDIKKDVTSFLRVGDSVAGLTVDEIRSDTVILKSGNEKIELR